MPAQAQAGELRLAQPPDGPCSAGDAGVGTMKLVQPINQRDR